MKTIVLLKYRLYLSTRQIMITPSNITLNKDKNLLTLTFEDVDYPLSAEFLRVYSPSAEVVGHGPGQETLQLGKENVKIDRIEDELTTAVVNWPDCV